MPDDPTTERRYTDEEMGKILARAVEPRARVPSTQVSGDEGYTLEQVEAIAAEAGIDPERIREAAVALTTTELHTGGLMGAPTNFLAERTVPFEGDEVTTAQIVAAIRRVTKMAGEVTEQEDSVTWRPEQHEGSGLTITVTRGRKGLTVSVIANGGFQGAVVWGATMFGAFMVGAVAAIALLLGDTPTAWSLSAWAGALGAGAWSARRLWRRAWGRLEQDWTGLLDQIAAEIERARRD